MQVVKQSFSNAASHYLEAALVQKEIGERLINRLDYFKISPANVLDLGAGPGFFTHVLNKRFKQANVVALDISFDMLAQIKNWFRPYPRRVQADMSALPFKPKSFDLIFANQLLHWSDDLKVTLGAIREALAPEGLFLFSTLGPDTFSEIKKAWAEIDGAAHVNEFSDMHFVGDDLQHSGFSDVVMDMEYLTLRYKTVKALCRDLKAQGVKNIHPNRPKGLMSKGQWQAFEKAYEMFRDEEGLLPLSYEVVYGQAFRAQQKRQPSTEQTIQLSDIGGRRG